MIFQTPQISTSGASGRSPLLPLLLLTDLAFIVLHLLYVVGVLQASDYDLTRERSYAEIFQYVKEFWLCLLFLGAAVWYRLSIYAVCSLLFGYLLADDALELHERLGMLAAAQGWVQPLFGVDAADLTQLLLFSGIGLGFVGLLLAAYYRSPDEASPLLRRFCTRLVILVVMLAGFGVLTDLVHSLVDDDSWGQFLGLMEDGGEMLIMTLILSHTWPLLDSPPAPDAESL